MMLSSLAATSLACPASFSEEEEEGVQRMQTALATRAELWRKHPAKQGGGSEGPSPGAATTIEKSSQSSKPRYNRHQRRLCVSGGWIGWAPSAADAIAEKKKERRL
mmetsp:Transcript_35383/g.53207  ORF Transcript_35383/g.53207 Transcript_35383/m.53207 type:complete len:106 (+) Transcript_35383:202-519(+)